MAVNYFQISDEQRQRLLYPQTTTPTPTQNNAYNVIGQQAGAQASTQQNSKGLLESVLGGIGNSIADVGRSVLGLIGTGAAGVRDLAGGSTSRTFTLDEMQDTINKNRNLEGADQRVVDSYQKALDTAKANGMNQVTGYWDDDGLFKLGGEGKNQSEFKKWLYGENEKTGTANYARTAGEALDAAATLSNFIPGANGIVGNTLQGAASGFGQTYADTGGDLESALKAAAASGLAGAATGKLNKGFNNVLSKGGTIANFATKHPLLSTATRGAVSGAVGGGVGGGATAALNGGGVADIASTALQGAGVGALGGGVSAPIISKANQLVSKIPGIKGVQGGINEMEQEYQAKQQLKKLPQKVAEAQPIEEVLTNKQAVEPEIPPVEEPQNTINRVARPEKDRVYATQLMDDVEFDDGIRSVKFNNEDIANSVAKDTGLDSILGDKELFNAAMAATPDTDPTNIADQVLPKQTRDLISQSLDAQNLTPKSYKKNVINKLTDFILGEGNQGVETVYYRDATDDKITGSRRISNNSETYKMLYNEFGDKPTKEYIKSTVDDYLSGRMDKVRQQKFENALEWDRNAFDSTNIPEKGFKQTYESTGLDYDNFQKALANDLTLRSRINKSLVDNSELTMPILADKRLKANENAMARQAQLDADYDARKAVAQAQADEINRANGWDEYDQYLEDIKTQTKIPKTKTNRKTTLADSMDDYTNAKARSYRKKEADVLLRQYNTVDKNTAVATDPQDTVLKLKDMGFSKKSEIEDMAGKITGKDGKLTGLVKKVAENSAPIDTTTGPEGFQTMDEYIDRLTKDNGLSPEKAKTVKTQIASIMEYLPTRKDGSIDFVDSGEDVFKTIQKLERRAAEKRGQGGNSRVQINEESLGQANVIEAVADEYRNRLFDNADVKKVLTPEVAKELKSYDPKNRKEWSDYVDNVIMKAQDARQLRSAQQPWVRINKIIENGDMNQVTYGGRVGNAYKIPTTEGSIKNRVINEAVNKIADTDLVRNTKANYYENQAKKAAGLPTESILPNRQTQTPVSETLPGTILPVDRLGNAIGRLEGARVSDLAQQLANMNTQEASQATQDGINGAYYAGATDYGTTATPNAYSAQASTGNSMLSRIETGIQNAFSAGDFEAVEYLMDMYNNVAKMYQTTETKQTKLTATQQRANAAAASLQRLANMTPDTGYTLSQVPILGGITTLGGNSYLSEAQSLAQQIGYMVSGANIKKEEAEAIGKAYVPQPFDSEQIRNEKLQRAAEIIAMYQNGYAEE